MQFSLLRHLFELLIGKTPLSLYHSIKISKSQNLQCTDYDELIDSYH
jgi:hypothetical protein